MIRVTEATSGYRYEVGEGWIPGALVVEFDWTYRAGTLTTGETVVEYRGSIEAAHGLFVVTGFDRWTERLTIEDLYGLVLRHVRIASVRLTDQDRDQAVTLAELIAREAECGVWMAQRAAAGW